MYTEYLDDDIIIENDDGEIIDDGESESGDGSSDTPPEPIVPVERVVISTVNQYYGTNDETDIPNENSNWTTDTPQDKEYLWVRVVTTYVDGGVEYSTPELDRSQEDKSQEGEDIPIDDGQDPGQYVDGDIPDRSLQPDDTEVYEIPDEIPVPVVPETTTQEQIIDYVQAQQELFNKLTADGQNEGIFYWEGEDEDKQLYINSSFIRTGVLQVGGTNNDFGVIQVMDENNNVIGQWDKTGFSMDQDSVLKIGDENETHLTLNYTSLKLIDKEGNTYFHVSDLRESEDGTEVTDRKIIDRDSSASDYVFHLSFEAINTDYSIKINGVDIGSTQARAKFKEKTSFWIGGTFSAGDVVDVTYTTNDYKLKAYTLGFRNPDNPIGGYSIAEGFNTTASGIGSHAEGFETEATGNHSHAEGYRAKAIGDYSHAEGSGTASGYNAHAEGISAASGRYSHAEGSGTASGYEAHAEGSDTKAIGDYSHAEGFETEATGKYSHASGVKTKASYDYQTVIGGYNKEVEDAIFIIGKGKMDGSLTRSNALEVSWSGDVRTPGTFIAEKSTNTPALYYRVDNLDSDANPSSAQYYGIARAWNKKSNETDWRVGSNIWYYQSSTGNGLMLEGGRYVRSLSASRYCGLRLLVNSSGNAVVQFAGNNSLNAWRDALGISQLASDKSWNNSISVSDVGCAGAITSSMKQIYFLIPYTIISGTAKVNSMSIVVRGGQTAGAEYIFAVSGASNNVYTQLGSGAVQIWNNSASVRTNEIESITATVKPRIGIQISIMFKNQLRRNNSGTVVYNNTPVNVRCTASISLS